MSNEVSVIEHGGVPSVSWTTEQVDLIKRTIAVGATHDELQLFMYQAKRTGLDPLSRQIHFVKRKDKGAIQTAIDGYRLIADRTGKYAGSDDYMFDEGIPQYLHMMAKRGTPLTATVTVYKMVDGSKVPFTATAGWDEYCPSDEKSGFMWRKMPYLMIGKCAEALALRKAFPAELSGIYTNEEMAQAGDGQPATSNGNGRADDQEMCVPNYGPNPGKPFSEVSTEHLKVYFDGAERSIADPKKANFLKKNIEMRDALKAEIAKRETATEPAKETPQQPQEATNAPLTIDDACFQLENVQSAKEFSEVMNRAGACDYTADEMKRLQDNKNLAKKRLGIK
jgi:phage recombination protein Bet